MFQKTFFIILVSVEVNLGFPMDMFIKSVAENNNFDNFDNYIPRYDDLASHNHPTLNHAKNETHVQEVPFITENEEDSSTPFVINVITTAEGIPTIELVDTVENGIKNISDSTDTLFSDFNDVGNTPNTTIIVNTYSDKNNEITKTEINIDQIPTVSPTTTIDTTSTTVTTVVTSQKIDIDKPTQPPNIIDTSANQKTTTTVDDLITLSNTLGDNELDFNITNSEVATEGNENADDKRNEKGISKTDKPDMSVINNTFNISDVDSPINETTRNPREETEKDDPEFADKESEEDGSSEEEEEDMNMITGLLSALLGGLSKPDGSIDLEAIVGLVGSLSTQNDDGTYDFQGLTELLKGFFGGGDGGGGSDIGAFTGGLLGAVIKGIANPPGGKGVGVLTAKILAGILPALSVQPPENMMEGGKPSLVKPGGLDLGGFLGGFIKTLFGASKGINPVKVVISTITSLSNSKPTQPKGNHK